MRESTFKQPLPSELQSKATQGHDAEGNAIAGKYTFTLKKPQQAYGPHQAI